MDCGQLCCFLVLIGHKKTPRSIFRAHLVAKKQSFLVASKMEVITVFRYIRKLSRTQIDFFLKGNYSLRRIVKFGRVFLFTRKLLPSCPI